MTSSGRDAPKIAECRRCNCSIAGGASVSLVELFLTHHAGHDEELVCQPEA